MSLPLEKVATGSVTLDWVDVNDAGEVFFIEGRPHESGRQTLLKLTADGQVVELTPSPISVRARVHEYGGKGYCLLQSGEVAYINDADKGALYVNQRKITDGSVRLADMIDDGDSIVAVAENEEQNFLASIDLKTGQIDPIFDTSDFVAAPSRSVDGKLLWLAWNHPHMPWDTTTLYCKDGEQIKALYGSVGFSILQPEWGPGQSVIYLSDQTGFWNLFQNEKPLFLMSVDCAKPPWVLGNKTFAFEGDDLILAFQKEGFWKLAHRRQDTWIILPLEFADLSSVRLKNHVIYFAASFVDDTRKICSFDLKTWVLKKLYGQKLELEIISIPEVVNFSSGGQTVTAYYYRPTLQQTGIPPLLVRAHGGPTAQTTPSFNWTIAFWTSQGYGYLDVNYRGSSGSGRKFRESLYGQWGVYDWQDCEKAASIIIKRGLADPKAVFITGSSAGGYTVLSALTYSRLFTAGTSYYGVINLESLIKSGAKFESFYVQKLAGVEIVPFPLDELNRPLLFFHGKEDKVVPPNQPEELFNMLKEKGIPTDLKIYEKEGHGFRGQEAIIDTLQRELAFYNQFVPPRPAPIEIVLDEPSPDNEEPLSDQDLEEQI